MKEDNDMWLFLLALFAIPAALLDALGGLFATDIGQVLAAIISFFQTLIQ